MARHKDSDWILPAGSGDGLLTWEQAGIAVLMDIRDRLNVLRCRDFLDMPFKLDRIARQTSKPRSRKRQSQSDHARRYRISARRARVLRRGR
jgi:hypothetical protein